MREAPGSLFPKEFSCLIACSPAHFVLQFVRVARVTVELHLIVTPSTSLQQSLRPVACSRTRVPNCCSGRAIIPETKMLSFPKLGAPAALAVAAIVGAISTGQRKGRPVLSDGRDRPHDQSQLFQACSSARIRPPASAATVFAIPSRQQQSRQCVRPCAEGSAVVERAPAGATRQRRQLALPFALSRSSVGPGGQFARPVVFETLAVAITGHFLVSEPTRGVCALLYA